MTSTHDMADIRAAYRDLGLSRGDTVYVLSALWQMGGFRGGAEHVAAAHCEALREIIGAEGTIVVSTATMNLCNTDIPFDPLATPSFNAGNLAEDVRRLSGTLRSFHPFGSYAANGPRAAELTGAVSRHAFGPETPEARMIERGAIQVNIGLPPNINTTVGHVEHVMAVPYRYTKEFMHPVVRGGEIRREPFYMYVRRLDMAVSRNHCKRLFERLQGRLPIRSARIGRGGICAYSMADFYRQATQVFADDIYIWCAEPPAQRPYRD